MKRWLVYFKVNRLKIFLTLGFAVIFIFGILFLRYCVINFFSLESFSRKQISGQMALLAPMFLLVNLFAMPFAFLMHYFLMQGGALSKIGQEKIGTAKTDVKWSDVIGMEAVKKEAWELVQLLKDKSLVKAIGGKIIKGTLMMGPPGCGKTYLAKAIAGECGLPILSTVGSEFVGIIIGQGAMRMKNLFKQARALAEIEGGCIIFIDEIDSFARPRQQLTGFGGGMSHNATINQFLTEMDGLRQTENNIVIIAATNVSEDELDPAIMRAGRFDRKIYVNLPNLKEREELFKFYLGRVKADDSAKPEILARKTLWFSPSDIASMVREAGVIALREKRDTITFKNLSAAYDRVIYGMKSNIQLSEKDKEWVAHHEAGHAIIGYLLHPTNDVIKATIVPHRGALGFVAPRPKEEIYIRNREWYLASIKVSLASYAAEKIKFGTTGSGVHADFRNAMSLAHDMVWKWGMGKSGYLGDFDQINAVTRGSYISEKTKEKLDEDVQEILQSSLQEVTSILTDKKDLLSSFAQELLKKGELEYDEIESIFDKFGLQPYSRK